MRDEDAAGSQPTLPRISQDEINLTEFPIALLSDRSPKNKAMVRRFTSGNKVWEIHGDPEHGFPTHLDHEVYVVLMEVTYEQGFPERVLFSRHDLLRRLGWGFSATRYARLQQAIDCWAGVKIRTLNSFYDKTNKKWLDRHIFHLLEESRSIEQDDSERSSEGATAWFRWSETIRQSMQVRYLKPLDVDLFLKLKSAVAQMLYRYLDAKRLNGKITFQQGIVTLGKQHLGMPEQYYPSQIKRLLDPAHAELIATGFMESAHYELMRGAGGEKVVYRFATQKVLGRGESRDEPQAHPRLPDDAQQLLLLPDPPLAGDPAKSGPPPPGHSKGTRPPPLDPLAQQLIERGMTAKIAARLVTERREECERQLEYLPYRAAKNPGGTLRKAIEEAWAPPEEWQKAGKAVGCRLSAVNSGPATDSPDSRQPTAEQQQDAAAKEAFAAAWAARTAAEQETLLEQALAEFRAENALGATCLARAAVERQVEVLQPLLALRLRDERRETRDEKG